MMERLIPIPMLLSLFVLINHCVSLVSALEHKCIHDTEEMQTLFYGPIVDNNTGLRHAFTPQGILERTAPQQYIPMPPPDAPDEVHRAFHATAIGNIRIVISALDLVTPGRYCTKKGDVFPDFKSGNVSCTKEDILTDEKRDILMNKVLPAALRILSSALKVNRIQGNLINRYDCARQTIPESHNTKGVPDADFVLYVSAAPTSVVAYASYCAVDNKGRPIVGFANFGPRYLVWKDNARNGQRMLVGVAVHEILHSLGFDDTTFLRPIATEKRRGKTVRYLSSKTVVEKAREYFNCPTLRGPEIEYTDIVINGSHWLKKFHRGDVMVGSVSTPMFLSPITLAVLQDSGHYIIDWSKAETPRWMYKAGCGVFTEKCNTEAGGLGTYFCNDDGPACTSDYRSIGKCKIKTWYKRDLPSWAQYFHGNPKMGGLDHMMDYCPIVTRYSNGRCSNPANGDANTSIIPQYYATDGRCFKTDKVIQNGNSAEGKFTPANCLQTRCVSKAVQFKMPGNDAWIPCPSKGAQVTLLQYRYKGSVICPDPKIICDGLKKNTKATNPTKTSGAALESDADLSSTIPAVLISLGVFIYFSNV